MKFIDDNIEKYKGIDSETFKFDFFRLKFKGNLIKIRRDYIYSLHSFDGHPDICAAFDEEYMEALECGIRDRIYDKNDSRLSKIINNERFNQFSKSNTTLKYIHNDLPHITFIDYRSFKKC